MMFQYIEHITSINIEYIYIYLKLAYKAYEALVSHYTTYKIQYNVTINSNSSIIKSDLFDQI